MGPKGAAADAVARHLQAAIERVREDVEKLEFWADAMNGFSEPVPDYGEDDVKVWMPPEQATRISSSARKPEAPHKRSNGKPEAPHKRSKKQR